MQLQFHFVTILFVPSLLSISVWSLKHLTNNIVKISYNIDSMHYECFSYPKYLNCRRMCGVPLSKAVIPCSNYGLEFCREQTHIYLSKFFRHAGLILPKTLTYLPLRGVKTEVEKHLCSFKENINRTRLG